MPYITLTVAPWTALDNAVRIEHKTSPSLEMLQMIIGGYIETVPHLTSIEINGKRVRCTVYCNENARLEGMQRNHSMSKLWKAELLRQRPNAEFSYEPELFGPVTIVIKAKAKAAAPVKAALAALAILASIALPAMADKPGVLVGGIYHPPEGGDLTNMLSKAEGDCVDNIAREAKRAMIAHPAQAGKFNAKGLTAMAIVYCHIPKPRAEASEAWITELYFDLIDGDWH